MHPPSGAKRGLETGLCVVPAATSEVHYSYQGALDVVKPIFDQMVKLKALKYNPYAWGVFMDEMRKKSVEGPISRNKISEVFINLFHCKMMSLEELEALKNKRKRARDFLNTLTAEIDQLDSTTLVRSDENKKFPLMNGEGEYQPLGQQKIWKAIAKFAESHRSLFRKNEYSISLEEMKARFSLETLCRKLMKAEPNNLTNPIIKNIVWDLSFDAVISYGSLSDIVHEWVEKTIKDFSSIDQIKQVAIVYRTAKFLLRQVNPFFDRLSNEMVDLVRAAYHSPEGDLETIWYSEVLLPGIDYRFKPVEERTLTFADEETRNLTRGEAALFKKHSPYFEAICRFPGYSNQLETLSLGDFNIFLNSICYPAQVHAPTLCFKDWLILVDKAYSILFDPKMVFAMFHPWMVLEETAQIQAFFSLEQLLEEPSYHACWIIAKEDLLSAMASKELEKAESSKKSLP